MNSNIITPVGYLFKKGDFLQKMFTINIIYEKTTTKYKVFLLIKRQQTFFELMGFHAFLTTYITQPNVTNFLCKDPPVEMNIFFLKEIFFNNSELLKNISEELLIPHPINLYNLI
jgi:hypothetical protein